MLPSYAHAAHVVGEEFDVGAQQVGDELDVAGLYGKAAEWYQRALGIFPGLPKTQEALAKLRARAAQPSVLPEAAP